jgi:hypothetical protein
MSAGDIYYLRNWTTHLNGVQLGYKVTNKNELAVVVHLGNIKKGDQENLDLERLLFEAGLQRRQET